MADKSHNCKVVLLGESGVGKTCIISRYVNTPMIKNLRLQTVPVTQVKSLNLPNMKRVFVLIFGIQPAKKNIVPLLNFSIKMQLLQFWYMT